MAKSINLNVDIKTKYEEQLNKVRSISSKLSKAGGYDGHLGPERLNKVNSLISSLDKMLKLDNLSFEQLTQLKNNFKDLFDTLETVSNGVVQLTPEMEKYTKQLKKAQEELENAEKARNEIVSKGKVDPTGKQFVNIGDFNKTIADLGAFRVKKDGNAYKTSMSDFATVYDRVVNKGEKVLTKDGVDISTTPEWKAMIKKLNEYNIQLAEANKVLAAKTAAEKRARTLVDKQVQIEKEQGITGVEFTEEITSSRSDTNALTNQLYQNKAEIIGTEKTISSLNTTIQKQQSALSKAFKQFTLYSIALRGIKNAGRAALQTIKELDKSLTEQAMVTGMTREQTYGLVKSYQDLALKVGATTKEIAGVATEYMKQGKTIEDSLKLTEAAVAAAKVARVSVGDSVNYLTTALNGFRLSAEDAMLVSDKFAAVAAASATDYDELAIALSKVASQANLAGMSIDYTTALLTKGLETTREAPETMGTALKTIIARMRELGDYGETLEGDTDINNVESQLAYVGIALRNANGELRSTEDVLDELGKKWDTLNTNQQAALAKALAGTRQQSRLIAMMDDYERVIELQEISQRSAGATSAQAATYLEGIEASLNAISVAWEKIVTNVTNSEIIVWLLERASIVLDKVGWFLDSLWGQIPVFTFIGVAIAGIISKKLLENKIAKEQAQLQRLQLKAELEKRKEFLIQEILKKNGVKLDEAELKMLYAKYHAQVAINKAKKGKSGATDISQAQQNETQAESLAKVADAQALVNKEMASGSELGIQLASTNEQLNLLMKEGNVLSSFSYMWMSLSSVAQKVWNTLKLAGIGILGIFNKKKREEIKLQLAHNAAANANPYVALAKAILTLLAVIVALMVVFVDWSSETEKASKNIQKLSNEIYKMNEASSSIKKTIADYEALDNQIIKTKEDLEEMNNLLNSAEESIDFTQGGKIKEKDAELAKENYKSLSEAQKLNVLKKEQTRLENEIWAARKKQLAELKKLNEEQRNYLLNEDSAVSSAVYATNNAYLYEQIDELKETSHLTDEQISATEDLGERILANLSAQEAYNWAVDDNGQKIKDLVKQLEELNVAEVLTSNDYTLKEQINAYKEAYAQLEGAAKDAFKAEFEALNTMSQWDDEMVGLVEKLGITADEVNNIGKAMQKLGVGKNALMPKFESFLKNINSSNNDIRAAIEKTFGAEIAANEDMYNLILNAYAEATGVTILNMGQNLDKLNNTINDFYKKAAEWSTMSASDKAQFINDNAELFADGRLYEAFESGNYAAIEEALKGNDALKNQVAKRITEVEQAIALEMAKLPEEQNQAYLKMLENELEYLKDSENLFEVSLETQLKQQEEQLNTYKEYLQEQKDALEDSLNKRKEAYQKYFDAINQDEEDEDYEEQANTLIANLSKLSSSTSADAKKQSKELENQLKELEEERLKTLRERAQEAVIENMDDTLDEINNKFDELINSNKALLAAMNGDLSNGEDFISRLMTNKINSGATALELENFWKELESTYSSVLTGVDWDSFKASESGNSMFLNVNGQTIELSPGNQQSVYEVIMKALRQVGVS